MPRFSLSSHVRLRPQDIVIKQTQPLRVAEATGTAAGLTHEHIASVYMELAPMVIEHLTRSGAGTTLYLETDDGVPSVTELQVPIVR